LPPHGGAHAIARCHCQVASISVMKAILARRTGKSSWRNVRPPLTPLDTPR
jgi:hypothetical protein